MRASSSIRSRQKEAEYPPRRRPRAGGPAPLESLEGADMRPQHVRRRARDARAAARDRLPVVSRGAGGRRPPLPLVLAASVVVFLVLLPLAYLVIRVASGGGRSLELLWDPETLRLVLRTVLLVVGVVTATIVVAVPFAWLVVRTDLPGRRIWATAAALPLVIPSFVAALALLGAFAPRRFAGGARAARRRTSSPR